MKKSVIVSVVTLLSVSFLLGGCGKSPKEEYADLCKKYEPYNRHALCQKIDKIPKNIKITEEQHKNLDNFKNHVIEGEKIFSEIKALVEKNPADLKKDFDWTFIIGKDSPDISKWYFNRAVNYHKTFHKGCTYDFKF